MNEAMHTKGPWEGSKHRVGVWTCNPKTWEAVKHKFPKPPYEGDLENEWGVYPPLGEAGPVALVAGEANARLIAAAPDLLAVAQMAMSPDFDWHERLKAAARTAISKATQPEGASK